MSFEGFWNILQLKKKIPDGGKVTLTKEQFKKQLQQAYDAGYKSGNNAQSVFEKVFGKDGFK